MENYTDRNDGCNESDILFYIEWAQQREPSIQFHIESVLNGVRVRHYSALNGGRQTPNVHCLFLFNGTHSFLLNSACGSELNGSRQSPNVRCLFLYRYRWYFHLFVLNSARGSEMNGGQQTPNVRCLFLYRRVKANLSLSSPLSLT